VTVLKNLLLLVATIFIVIASLEIGLRFNARGDVRAQHVPDAGSGKDRCDPVTVHDRVLGWRHMENCTSTQVEMRGHEYAMTLHFNNHGFRDNKDYRYAKTANVKRAVLIGDSMSVGNGVEEVGRASNRLEGLFGGKLEVYNLAVSAYGLDQAYLMLLEKGFLYDPDIVLLGLSDPMFERLTRSVTTSGWSKPFFTIIDGRLRLNLQPDESILTPKSFLDRSYLWEFIRNRIALLPRERVARDAVRSLLTEKILADIAALTKSRGAKLVVFSVNPHYILKRREGAPALNRLISEVALRYDFSFIDLYPSLHAGDYARLSYPIDGHFNGEGHMLVAEELCKGLRSLRLVDGADDVTCRLDREKVYAAVEEVRHCDFDNSGKGLALGGKCLPLQCAPIDVTDFCVSNGTKGRRTCQAFEDWGTRWGACRAE
jgi:hypothetical protein